tara:strand:- start:3889 stop:4491 length:603 start_codon:yes stop_codon:yes gene_type:complete
MNLKYSQLSNENSKIIRGPILLKPKIFGDDRGFFFESWNKKNLYEVFKDNDQKEAIFVQDNHSKSTKGVLRGLHYQRNPIPQGKLVRCIKGEIFDVAVDIRKKSETYGSWVSAYLNSENKYQLWIPEGFAHGFLTMSETAEVAYKTTNYWDKDCERSIIWEDKDINIKWPIENNKSLSILLSEKDKKGMKLCELKDEDLF